MGEVSGYASMLVVFFFFKQKTAYEMRMSDWSSDVCSSDLFAIPAIRGVGGGVIYFIDQGLAEVWDVEFQAAPALPATDAGLLAIDHVAQTMNYEEMQSGRASCRERVCQYV